ncbi:hypothetical protein NDU88_005109 [Pleurodeles waltl]|uniref:Uncharacterized protein n=1 Tax=Pleurodeles waltl TaxID=8319 RepID=A0AAV7SKW6_PLEWA|nr:hypothetical protein NDU88_005109 [Pleurodeles waltl]
MAQYQGCGAMDGRCQAHARILLDHSLVLLRLGIQGCERRDFLWRLRCNALKDSVFREEVRTTIKEYFATNKGSVSLTGNLWEAFKVVIRGISLAKQHGNMS